MKTEVIAEIGQAHDGSLGILHSYIDAVSNAGANVIKFQTHIASAESSKFEKFRVNFSRQDNTRYDYWKRMEFTKDQWKEIKAHCDELDIEFMSSPFSISAVELLEEIGVKRYKIGSGETNNLLMLSKIAETGKPIILSTGMSSYNEIDEILTFLNQYNLDLSIMQCTTSYPVEPERLGLNVIKEMQDRYKLPTGLSDHSGTIYPSLAAAALGANMVEVHVTFSKQIFGPDTKSSIIINDLESLVNGINIINTSLSNPVNKDNSDEFDELKNIFGKSLTLNKDLKNGDSINISDLETTKPAGRGIHPKDFESIIGKKLKINKKRNDFLNYEDLIL